MTPKERVLQILRGPEASRIRFTVPSVGITINRATFATVAHAIETGRIAVLPHHDPHSGAAYLPLAAPGAPSGRLFIPRIFGRGEEGLTLHECTHAFFDLNKIKITAENEEAICYVVDALYFRMTALPQSRWTKSPHSTARLVADGLLKEYAAGTHAIPEVNATSWHIVRLAVMTDPIYLTRPPGFPAQLLPGFAKQLLGIGPDSYDNDG